MVALPPGAVPIPAAPRPKPNDACSSCGHARSEHRTPHEGFACARQRVGEAPGKGEPNARRRDGRLVLRCSCSRFAHAVAQASV